MNNEKVIAGADLGTNSSTLAMLDEKSVPVPMKNAEGDFATRSAVLFPPGEPPIIGQQALNAALLHPNYLAREMKLHIGEKDSHGQDIAMVTDADGKPYTAVQIQGIVADKLIKDANAQSSRAITDIVLSVPVNYANNERQSLLQIAKQVGCNILGLIEEPVAVAYTFINACKTAIDGIFLVFDMGAGTTDLTLLEISGGSPRVQMPKGKPNLGGRRCDMALIEVVAAIAKRSGIDIESAKDPSTLHEFHDKIENAKKTLTQSEKALFYMNFEGKILKTEIARQDFENACTPIRNEMKDLIRETLVGAKLDAKDLKGILLNGPSCQMPMIQAMLNDILPGVPLRHDIDPVTSVAQGSALVACKYAQQDGHEAISKSGTKLRTLDAVATLRSVATHALGCKHLADKDRRSYGFAVIIPSNTPLPTTKSDTFGVVDDRQNAVDVEVYQQARDGDPLEQCQYIATVRLDGITPGHVGEPRIIVQYSYNRSGIVEVTVTDTISKKTVSSNVSHNLGNL